MIAPAHKLRTLVLIAMAAIALLVGGFSAQPATASSAQLGKPVKIEQLPTALWLPNTAKAYRVHYVSTGQNGKQTVVSGAVFIPTGKAPKKGWPVVSWGHGTVGIADTCANSTAGRSARDTNYLGALLGAGYAVVSSDYEGFGTPGTHLYLYGKSEGYGIIDMVRAARKVDSSLSRTWLAVGQSQGAQGVLFAGAMEHKYAPELDFRGTIATAPPTQFRDTIASYTVLAKSAPVIPNFFLVFPAIEAAHPGKFEADDYVTPAGKELMSKAEKSDCYSALAVASAGKTNGEYFDVSLGEYQKIADLFMPNAEIPIVKHHKPLFIAQGTVDTVVSPEAAELTADRLRAKGNDVTFKSYPGVDHLGLMPAALQDVLAFADELVH